MNVIVKFLKTNRIAYFGYFLKKTNWSKLKADISYVAKEHKHSCIYLLWDMVYSSIRYGCSFHEYYYYSFYAKSKLIREQYASMTFVYEHQLLNNPQNVRYLIADKIVFLDEYKELIGRKWLAINKSTLQEVDNFISSKTKVILKNAKGGAGKNVKVINLNSFSRDSLIKYAMINNYDLMEEFVFQHKDLMELSPSSLNTVRIITQISEPGFVKIIGTILRLGIGLETDNLSTGGIACPIDPNTGLIIGYGISFDNSKPDYKHHPISGKELMGFKIPYWQESLDLCKKAALLHPENKSIGWDVAITDNGPLLIEGNHDWGARLWQMPVKKGLKHLLK